MKTPHQDIELSRSNRLLDSLLTQVLKNQNLPEIVSAVERLQSLFADFTSVSNTPKHNELRANIQSLNPDYISGVVRVFNHYFSLLNIAEESYYLGLRRRQAEQGGHFWANSFHDTLLTLKDSGLTADKLQVLLDELLYLPVMTAHPTEAKRRTVKNALRNVFVTHEMLGDKRLKGYLRQETDCEPKSKCYGKPMKYAGER